MSNRFRDALFLLLAGYGVQYAATQRWQTLELLKIRWERKSFTEDEWRKTLEEVEKFRVWEIIPPGQPYGSADAMLKAEIGETVKSAVNVLRGWGGDRKSGPFKQEQEENQVTLRNLKKLEGETSDYLTARLKRSHQDIYQRLEDGQYKSVRAAALDAGIVKPRLSIPTDPTGAANAIIRNFNYDDLMTLINLLVEATQ